MHLRHTTFALLGATLLAPRVCPQDSVTTQGEIKKWDQPKVQAHFSCLIWSSGSMHSPNHIFLQRTKSLSCRFIARPAFTFFRHLRLACSLASNFRSRAAKRIGGDSPAKAIDPSLDRDNDFQLAGVLRDRDLCQRRAPLE